MTYTTIARHDTTHGFGVAVLTRKGRPGFLIARIDNRNGYFVTLAQESTEQAARAAANRVWAADMA